jgi:arsenate reductase (thioredoxin)
MRNEAYALTALQQKPPLKLLFLCTHNRCRSILAEAIATEVGGDLFQAASAGSEPAGEVHSLTLRSLERHGIPAQGLRSKALGDLKEFIPDFVITVCDKAAAEPCPLWLGKTRPFNWSLSDPSAQASGEEEREKAFDEIIATLTTRLRWLRAGVEQGLNHQGLVMLISALAETRPQPAAVQQ